MAHRPGPANRPRSVVALGASAGGLQALELFFGAMPAHSGLSCVVLPHLPANRDSHLAEILARFTDMTVLVAEDGGALEPDHAYVLPAGHAMGIRDRRLAVTPKPGPNRLHHPIDLFFDELARDQDENAVGIVLSGTGSDGTLGLRAIKEAGGLTLAQGGDGTAPAYAAMPSSAIVGGGVDLVLPAHEMAMRIIEVLETQPSAAAADGSAVVTRQHVSEIHALLRESSGHDFSGYKLSTFGRRVARQMQFTQITSPDAYPARLRADDDERHHLFVDLLISVTGFFRDPDAFEALASALPDLTAAKRPEEEEIRVWVPGCATGEEVFSIVMLLREQLDGTEAHRSVRIFATDINDAALNVARTGIYPAALVEPVGAERLQRFFEQVPCGFKAAKAVRGMCVFSSRSMIEDPPFSRMDLISCRNLPIYVDAAMQDRLVPVFHFALRSGTSSECRVGSANGSAHCLVRIQPYRSGDETVGGVTVAFIDVTTLADFAAHQEALIEELNHRVRNMLTVIVVLAKQTVRGHPDPIDFRGAFIPRIEAPAKTYQLVSRERWRWRWRTLSLAELIRESVGALCPEPDCVDVAGPPVLSTPKAALALGLVLAELATNAVKYGALSRQTGRIEMTWRLHHVQGWIWLVLRWLETGGPPVERPRSQSFGSILIRREIKHDLGGRVTLRFAPDGLQAVFRIPFEPKLFRAGREGDG